MFKLLLCGPENFVVIATFAKTSLYVAKLKCTSVKFLGSGNRYIHARYLHTIPPIARFKGSAFLVG